MFGGGTRHDLDDDFTRKMSYPVGEIPDMGFDSNFRSIRCVIVDSNLSRLPPGNEHRRKQWEERGPLSMNETEYEKNPMDGLLWKGSNN